MSKYHDITPEAFISILEKYFDKQYIDTWRRRFKKSDKPVYIDSAIKEIYKAKGIDIRMDILDYRANNKLINSYYFDQSRRQILNSKVVHGKTKWI